jgi:hypothetical protein
MLSIRKQAPSCCLVTGYFTCLNIATCDVYLAEGRNAVDCCWL